MLNRRTFLALVPLLLAAPSLARAGGMLDDAKQQELLKRLDESRMNRGDYKALMTIEHVRRGEPALNYEALLYRRDEEDKLVLLLTAPKADAGKGYLKIGGSAFMYDPSIGDWERRTEREGIAGTSAKRSDLDRSRFSTDYVSTYRGAEMLQKHSVHHLELVAKPGALTHAAKLHLWVDQGRNLLLKQQDFTASGKLLRTVYFPEWSTETTPSGRSISVPRRIVVYDEIEKGTGTTVTTRAVDFAALPLNIFTKAWVESRSR